LSNSDSGSRARRCLAHLCVHRCDRPSTSSQRYRGPAVEDVEVEDV